MLFVRLFVFNSMAAVTTHSDFEAQKIKSFTASLFPLLMLRKMVVHVVSQKKKKKTLILLLALLVSYNDNPLLETFSNVIKVFVFPAGKAIVVISVHEVIKGVQ